MVDQRAREKNRLEKRQSRKAEASIKRAIRWNTNEIGRLDREYKKALEKSRGLRQRAELYQSVRGGDSGNAGGRIAGTGARRWEGTDIAGGTGTVDARQRTAEGVSIDPRREGNGAEGVVPGGVERNTEAGKQTGVYQRLRRRGKPGKVALVAVMRKLLMQLHAVAQRGSPWLEDYSPAI